MAGRWFATHRRLGPAAMVLLLFRPQNAVEAGLRGEVAALVRQAWHDLAGRQALEGLAVADIQHGLRSASRHLVLGGRRAGVRPPSSGLAVPGLPRPPGPASVPSPVQGLA